MQPSDKDNKPSLMPCRKSLIGSTLSTILPIDEALDDELDRIMAEKAKKEQAEAILSTKTRERTVEDGKEAKD